MSILKSGLELFATYLLYSSVVILIDFVIVLFFTQDLHQIVSSLSLLALVEGGLGLTIGGSVAVYSSLGAKIVEVVFHSKPWNAERQKEAEKEARAWIATGSILIFVALFISAV